MICSACGYVIYLVLNGASLGWFINQVFYSYYKCFIGTETDFFAGLRGCRCLENHYRTNMFKECKKCEVGLECKDDYATLKPGYWGVGGSSPIKIITDIS